MFLHEWPHGRPKFVTVCPPAQLGNFFALPHRRGPAALGGRGQGRRGAHELDELERRAAGASMHAYGGADVVVHAELC